MRGGKIRKLIGYIAEVKEPLDLERSAEEQ
jgi:hypothetical protein